MKQYYKVWFTNGSERTAGLVFNTEAYPIGKTSISEYSRCFPYTEAMKMRQMIMTSTYDSFEEAFHERSKAMDLLLTSR